MNDKNAVLVAVKDGTLTVEQALVALRKLQDKMPLDQSQIAVYEPSWVDAPATNTTQSALGLVVVNSKACLSEALGDCDVVLVDAGRYLLFVSVSACIRNETPLKEFSSLHEFTTFSREKIAQKAGLWLLHASAENDVEPALLDVFAWVKSLSTLNADQSVQRWSFGATGEYAAVANEAIAGFLRGARVENPNCHFSVLFDFSVETDHWREELAAAAEHVEVRYLSSRRQVLRLVQTPELSSQTPAWLHNKCHLIISGGGGELALSLSRILLEREDLCITLLGRSPAKPAVEKLIAQHSSRVAYQQADISDKKAVDGAIRESVQRFAGDLVLVHCAGVLADSFINKASADQYAKVLAPKYQGTINLLRAVQAYSVNSVILFSSIAAYLPHSGQSFYASANRAMTALAKKFLPSSVALQVLHWPLWDGGGMDISAEDKALMRSETGMAPMPQALGWQVLLKSGAGNSVIAFGDKAEIVRFIGDKDAMKIRKHTPRVQSREQAQTAIIDALCDATKFPSTKVKPKLSLQAMGLDSMIITRLNVTLEKQFGTLPKTLLFDCQTIADLTDAILSRVEIASQPGTSEPVSIANSSVEVQVTADQTPQISQPHTDSVDAKAVAIIGLAGRYPAAENIDEFWQNLVEGKDSITEIPADRWDWQAYYRPQKTSGFSHSKWGGFLNDVDAFDPLFFAISPREAESIDPQERLFLQTVWHTLEDAGYSPQRLREYSRKASSRQHAVGVYVGVTSGQYQQLSAQDWGRGERTLASSAYWSIANRVSFFLNLQGPSIAIDTACSASLSAITLGYESLVAGKTKMALVGGVNINLDPSRYVALSDMGFLSLDGRCRSFGKGGTGFVPSEGVGAALLKPLSAAKKDGDNVYAVIRGAAVNHSGSTNGYSVPSPQSQALLVHDALQDAGVNARDITLVETHGTGTALGDPIEVDGLTQAFRMNGGSDLRASCALSSVKSNIGHLESAAGIAGLTKLVLQLHRRQRVPSLHADVLNPALDLENTPFFVQTDFAPWLSESAPRIGGLSSFGAGGSNAHLIVEQAPGKLTEHDSRDYKNSDVTVPLAVFSANNPAGLARLCRAHLDFLEAADTEFSFACYLFSLQTSRAALNTRIAIHTSSKDALISELMNLLATDIHKNTNVQKLVDEDVEDDFTAPADNLTLNSQELQTLQEGWLSGKNWRWENLWQGTPVTRIPLPLYPFAKMRLWYRERSFEPVPNRIDNSQVEWSIPPAASAVADHVIQEHPILSGMGHLSLVLASLKECGLVEAQLSGGYEFTDVHWLRPLASQRKQMRVTVEVQPQNDTVQFRVKNVEGELASFGKFKRLGAEPSRMQKPFDDVRFCASDSWRGERLYQAMAASGFTYGPAYQYVDQLEYSESQVNFELQVAPDTNDVFHPGFVDSMLQSIFVLHSQQESAPAVPFKVASIRVYEAPCKAAKGSIRALQSTADGEYPYQISAASNTGKPVIEFDQFVARRIESAPAEDSGVVIQHVNTAELDLNVPTIFDHCYVPRWVALESQDYLTMVEPTRRHVVITGSSSSDIQNSLLQKLREAEGRGRLASLAVIPIQQLASSRETLNSADTLWFTAAIYPQRYSLADTAFVDRFLKEALFNLLKLAKHCFSRSNAQRLIVLSNDAFALQPQEHNFHPLAAGLLGFTKAFAQEARQVECYHLDLSQALVEQGLLPVLFANLNRLVPVQARLPGCAVANHHGEYVVEKFSRFAEAPQATQPQIAFRDAGVYLIIGGAGGLGLAFAKHLREKYGARVILVGRRSAAAVAELVSGQFDYRQCDISDAQQVQLLLKTVQQEYGALHGVVHSALTLQDTSVAKMQDEDLAAALNAKVFGTIQLMESLTALNLDFILFFSSTISQTCSPGQSNYAAASLTQDALANYYARLHRGIRVVNWGFWHEIGVVADEFYRQRMYAKGLLGITFDDGLSVLDALLAGTERQLVALKLNSQGMSQWQPYLCDQAKGAQVNSQFSGGNSNSALHQLWQGLRPSFEHENAQLMNQYCQQRVLAILQKRGLFVDVESALGVQDVMNAFAAKQDSIPLVNAMLAMLARGHYLIQRGASWRLAPNSPKALDRATVLEKNSQAEGHLRLLDHCLDNLPLLLDGKKSDTEILFPGGSAHLVQATYRDNPVSDACNAMVAAAVQDEISRLVASGVQEINLVEIGAGTGSTTWPVAKKISANFNSTIKLHYWFTDLSSHFVARAKRELATEYPFIEAAVFDVAAADLAREQAQAGIPNCDILLASNVLHATDNIVYTLKNCDQLLKPRGRMIINEVTENWDFVTMTFGLTKGWWLFEDAHLRMPHSPLLSCAQWGQALRESGLEGRDYFGGGPEYSSLESEALGQTVILASASEGARATQVSRAEQTAQANTPSAPEADGTHVEYLKSVFARVLKIPVAELDEHDNFQSFGLDSIILPEVLNALQERFPALTLEQLNQAETIADVAKLTRTMGTASVEVSAQAPVQNALPLNANTTGSSANMDEKSALQTVAPQTISTLERGQKPYSEAVVSIPSGSDYRPQHSDTLIATPVPTATPAPTAIPNQAGRTDANTAEVAIIGVAGIYPGAANIDEFWQQLCMGTPAAIPVPHNRWQSDNSEFGSFLNAVDEFDPLFFGISPREAPQLDPQQRVMLDVCWHLLEDAGYAPETLTGGRNNFASSVGVYVASMYQHYGQLAAVQWAQGVSVAAESSLWAVANRISHALGLTGPSIGVDSACSGALNCVALAVDAIRSGQCDAAIAGGVNLIRHPGHHAGLAQAKMLAQGRECRPFAEQGSGMVTGEGAGAVLLKSYAAAKADGDQIYGVIAGVASNFKGQTSDGFAAPEAAAELAVMRRALAQANIPVDNIDYLEVSATGVARGDAAECDAVSRFIDETGKRTPTRIGSVKSQFGHLEAASGMAQLARVLLQMKHRQWLPTYGSDLPASLQQRACFIEQSKRAWPDENSVHYAGINAFAAGGSYVHLIVRNAPETQNANMQSAEINTPLATIFPLSARNPDQLKQVGFNLLQQVRAQSNMRLSQIAFTLQRGRKSLKYRALLVADSVQALQAELERLADGYTYEPDIAALPSQLQQIAQQWLAGSTVDWVGQYSGVVPGVVSLPGYPFARNSFWLAANNLVDSAKTAPSQPQRGQSESATGTSVQPSLQTTAHAKAENPSISQMAALQQQGATQTMSVESHAQLVRTISSLIADLQNIPLEEIDADARFEEFGFDSISYVEFAERLQNQFDFKVDATVFYQCTDIPQLADFVAENRPAGEPSSPQHTSNDLPAQIASQSVATVAQAAAPQSVAQVRSVTQVQSVDQVQSIAQAQPVQSNKESTENRGAMAIIGMSGQFPGSRDLNQFWQNLIAGEQAITTIPSDRFDASGIVIPETNLTYNTGGFIDDIDMFDAEFFQISPREARLMDPQHRLMLQTLFHTIADAGYHHTQLAGTNTGVFVGVGANSYGQLLVAAGEDVDGHMATGNVHSVLVNRISYLLDLTGPSEPINTACSSSLVAVHRAVQAIRNGECSSALVGGVNLMLDETGHAAFAKSGMLSASGSCHTFDASADGYARGEGCAGIWIKPLAQAQADGDHIYACVAGTAVGHGGRATSLTAPNVGAQKKVVQRALADAGLDAGALTYIETHGTGTALGDPVEINALKAVFAQSNAPCALGAVKTNIGHLETAAGIAGLIKTVLCLENEMLPAIAGLNTVNPLIDLDDSCLYLNRQLTPWVNFERARYAGVSSFGFGGVNSHVIVGEAPAQAAYRELPEGPFLATLSAPTQEQLDAYTNNLKLWLSRQAQVEIADLCYTLQMSRSQDVKRLAFVVSSTKDLYTQLDQFCSDPTASKAFVSPAVNVAGQALFDAEDTAAILESVIAQKNWGKLAKLWVNHVPLTLPLVGAMTSDRSGPMRRLSLPPVPFKQMRYWPKASAAAVVSAPAAAIEPKTQTNPAPVSTPAPAPSQSASPSPATVKPAVAPAKSAVKDKATNTTTRQPAPTVLAETPKQNPAEKASGTAQSTLSFSEQIQADVRAIIVDALDIEAGNLVDDKPFPEYGIDSIIGLRVMQKVQQRYGENLAMSAIIEEPTVLRLSQFIESNTSVKPELNTSSAAANSEDTTPAVRVRISQFGSAQMQTAWLFIADVSGELSWALNWMETSQDVQILGLEWSLADSPPSVNSIFDAVITQLAAVECNELVLVTKGYMAEFSVGLAQVIQKQHGITTHLKFISPQHGKFLDQGNFLTDLATTCSTVWRGRSTVAYESMSEPEKIHEIQVMALELMPRAAFDGWFDALMLNAQRLIPLLTGYMPPVWVNAYDSEIILSYEGEEVNLAKILVPPASVLRLNTTECLSRLAVTQYEKTYNVLAPGQQHDFPLVFVNREGDKTPTFWVHTLFGDVSFTLNLAHHLGKACPVLGIEQFTVDGDLHLLPSIKQMASHYIESIQTENPDGPYIIGGYSFGGVVAYEMCRQLAELGKPVEMLVMIDSFMPNTETFGSIDITNVEVENFDVMALLLVANNFARRFKITDELRLDHVDGLPLNHQFDVVSQFLQGGKTSLTYDEIYQLVENNYNTILTNNDALTGYQPDSLPESINVLLFHATQGFIAADNIYGMPEVRVTVEDRSNGFEPYVKGQLNIIDVEADHYSICHDRKLVELSKSILAQVTVDDNTDHA